MSHKPCPFKPSCCPSVCRYWYAEMHMGVTTHFCGSTSRTEKDCPTEGRSPYPQEDDGYQDHVDLG